MSDAPSDLPTVLLVDDEPLILMIAAEILGDAGFAVTQCASAEQALALVATGYRPDIMITDQAMSGMSGTDLAGKLLADIGLSAVLIASGCDDGVDAAWPTLTKPYREEELITRVRAMAAVAATD